MEPGNPCCGGWNTHQVRCINSALHKLRVTIALIVMLSLSKHILLSLRCAPFGITFTIYWITHPIIISSAMKWSREIPVVEDGTPTRSGVLILLFTSLGPQNATGIRLSSVKTPIKHIPAGQCDTLGFL